MCEINIMHVAINGNIKWQRTEEICFTQFGYSLTISYDWTAKMPSYLFDIAIQDSIDHVVGHLFAASE